MTQQYTWEVKEHGPNPNLTVVAGTASVDSADNLVFETDDVVQAIFARGSWEHTIRHEPVQPVVVNVIVVAPPTGLFQHHVPPSLRVRPARITN